MVLQVTRYSYKDWKRKSLHLKPMWSGYLGAKKLFVKAYGFWAWRVLTPRPAARKLFVQFYNLHKLACKSWTVKHFSQLGIARAMASATQRFLRTIRREAAQKESRDLIGQQSSFLLPEEDTLSIPSKTEEGAWWSLPRSSTCVMAHLDVLARMARALLARTPRQWWLHLLVGLSKLLFCPSHHYPFWRARNTIFRED